MIRTQAKGGGEGGVLSKRAIHHGLTIYLHWWKQEGYGTRGQHMLGTHRGERASDTGVIVQRGWVDVPVDELYTTAS